MRGGLGDLSGLSAAIAKRRGPSAAQNQDEEEEAEEAEAKAVSPAPVPAKAKVEPKTASKTKGMFDDDEDGDDLLFGGAAKSAAMPTAAAAAAVKPGAKPASKKSTSLFGGDEEEDEDLFGSVSKVRHRHTADGVMTLQWACRRLVLCFCCCFILLLFLTFYFLCVYLHLSFSFSASASSFLSCLSSSSTHVHTLSSLPLIFSMFFCVFFPTASTACWHQGLARQAANQPGGHAPWRSTCSSGKFFFPLECNPNNPNITKLRARLLSLCCLAKALSYCCSPVLTPPPPFYFIYFFRCRPSMRRPFRLTRHWRPRTRSRQ